MVIGGEEVKELQSQNIRWIIYVNFQIILHYDRISVEKV